MKTFWTIIVILVLSGVIGFAIWHSVAKSRAIENETSVFVTDTVNAISQGWKADALISRAEPGLVKAMTTQGQSIDDLFQIYSKLGTITTPATCVLKDTSQFDSSDGTYTTASYACDADYDKGHATFLITVRQKNTGGEWKVYYINISSPYFSEIGYQPTK